MHHLVRSSIVGPSNSPQVNLRTSEQQDTEVLQDIDSSKQRGHLPGPAEWMELQPQQALGAKEKLWVHLCMLC